MSFEDSPSSVMYADFKALKLSNRDVIVILHDTDNAYAKKVVATRLKQRSEISRKLVHVPPGEVPAELFGDFEQSALAILNSIVSKSRTGKGPEAYEMVVERFSGPSAKAMQQALEAYKIDSVVYRNALNHIRNLEGLKKSDFALLYLMLFLVTGCTGNPHEAARTVEEFASRNTGKSFKTAMADVGENAGAHSEDDTFNLGLARIVDGKLKGPDSVYVLSTGPDGSEIGTLASKAGAITDVDEDVSRHHAHIYKQAGHWYLIGLGSTNGTTVISGADKVERVVELPAKERQRGYTPEPVEIYPSDTICLGVSTRFMVIPVAGE